MAARDDDDEVLLAAVAKSAEHGDAEMPVDEFLRRAAVPPTDEEVAATLALRDRFVQRHPTVADRMGYVRRAYARWMRMQRE